jgi:hypothetical protein
VNSNSLGVWYAKQLAENRRERADAGIHREELPPLLTLEVLAFQEGEPRSTISARIARARISLFGDVSDSSVYRQLKRRDEVALRPRRVCLAPDCSELLPTNARSSRKFHHPRCRVRFHQQRERGAI